MKNTLALALTLFLALPLASQARAPARDASAQADAAFVKIHEAEWGWRQKELGRSPEDGDFSSRTRLPNVDAATQAARLKVWDDVLRQLDAIDPAALSHGQRINYRVYRAQVENLAAKVRFRSYEMPFNSDSSFWSNLSFMARRPFRNEDDYRAYIARLNDVPRYFDQEITNMRAGLARGFSVPRAVLDGRDVSIAMIAEASEVESLAFWEPFKAMPAAIPAEKQVALRQAGRAALAQRVQPAYAELLRFFREDYVPAARTTLAAEAMPEGEAWYRQQIREYTTLDLEPEAIHQTGLAEVARIRTEMEAIIVETGFEGDFSAFLEFLRTDPQFYVETGEELLMHAAWISKRVDAQIGKYMTLPRARFRIIPVPDDIAPFWTAGRGGNGTYWVNTYNLPARPLYNLPALTLHESDPGHALQGAIAAEQDAQPAFRRENYISAYGEGWGLYCEKLGVDMGIYRTPYEHFGRLTYEMWRAARLVIDTGIHHKGWSRDQALAFLRDNTALSEHEVTTEIDRYISWPAQALSYKLGEILIVKLRAEAEAALGDAFDIKAFHDTILNLGSVTLPVLEEEVRAFIADSAKKAEARGR
ncbi:MAG: DUF885 family protein [Chiayiivirga sp.]|jgi:uncharacterized protein (DUF885 family)|nr:DUF885 family protein [Chiayiivirga sp.]